jgi:hypothetical protein
MSCILLKTFLEVTWYPEYAASQKDVQSILRDFRYGDLDSHRTVLCHYLIRPHARRLFCTQYLCIYILVSYETDENITTYYKGN